MYNEQRHKSRSRSHIPSTSSMRELTICLGYSQITIPESEWRWSCENKSSMYGLYLKLPELHQILNAESRPWDRYQDRTGASICFTFARNGNGVRSISCIGFSLDVEWDSELLPESSFCDPHDDGQASHCGFWVLVTKLITVAYYRINSLDKFLKGSNIVSNQLPMTLTDKIHGQVLDSPWQLRSSRWPDQCKFYTRCIRDPLIKIVEQYPGCHRRDRSPCRLWDLKYHGRVQPSILLPRWRRSLGCSRACHHPWRPNCAMRHTIQWYIFSRVYHASGQTFICVDSVGPFTLGISQGETVTRT